MNVTIEKIQQVLDRKGFKFFDNHNSYNLNIIGVRSNSVMANSFDDWLYLVFRDEEMAMQMHCFSITTDPGTYWLEHPMNVNGTAVLVPGQYRGSHMLGKHRGKYDALVQAKPVKVYRDNNGDNVLDFSGPIEEGLFGLNIHRSSATGSSQVVEKWSAGCQVFQNVSEYNFFIETCKQAVALYGNSFTYTLLEEKDFN